MRGHSRSTALIPADRRLVLGVAVAQVTLLTLTASLNFVLPAIVEDFQATPDQEATCRQVASIASLLVVFLAGSLGSRLGSRRVLLAAGALFVAGSLIMATAPSILIVTLGLLIASIGKAVLGVVALAVLASRIRDQDGRATAFATISALVPIAYMVMPLVAGALVDGPGWRWVAAIWVLCGLVSMGAILIVLPADGVASGSGEMLTPALAGVVLAAGIQSLDDLTSTGWGRQTAALGVIAVIALGALILAYRRMSQPTLTLAPLRRGGLLLLIVVMILFSFSNLYYYTTMLYEISYGYSTMAAAILMIPTQGGAVLGAIIARKLLQAKGITFAGTSMVLLLAGTLAVTALVPAGVSVVFPAAMVTIYAAASVAAFVAVTNAVMNLAVPGEEGTVSSYKTAAGSIGGALGIALATVVVSLVGQGVMSSQLEAEGIYSQQTIDASWELIEGTQPRDVSDLYGIPPAEIEEITAEETVAYYDSYRAQAAVGAVVSLAAGLLFLVTRRRQERDALSLAEAGE